MPSKEMSSIVTEESMPNIQEIKQESRLKLNLADLKLNELGYASTHSTRNLQGGIFGSGINDRS